MDDKGVGPLTRLQHLNCWMDSKAKSLATSIRITDTFEVPSSPLGFGLVSCNGSLISSNLSKQLYHQLCHQAFVRHLETRWDLPQGLLSTKVDWTAFRKARVNSSAPIQKFVTKWLSESLPTGRVMVQRQQRIHDHCPLCQDADEHLLHIVCCPDTRATEFFASQLDKFTCWLEKINTHVAIIDFFDNGLANWRQNPVAYVPLLHFYPVDAQVAFRKQLEVGWFLTLCGFLSPALLQLQTNHYRSLGRCSSGVQWGQKCIRRLWDLVYNLWTYRNTILHEAEIHNLHGHPTLDGLAYHSVSVNIVLIGVIDMIFSPFSSSIFTLSFCSSLTSY